MARIVLDDLLRARLQDLSQPIELCDEAGNVVAQVFPVVNLSQYEPWEPPIDEEEMQRRERSDQKRYTTAEVLQHLESLQ